MDNASKDVLFIIAMQLDLPTLLRWCQSSARINKNVCNNDNLWRSKLMKDYPDYQNFNLEKSMKETYVFMYQLSYIKRKMNSDESLHDIFLKEKINFVGMKIKKVPAFDLPNLKKFHLSYNELTEVPEFNLPNLELLSLSDNKLRKVPPFNYSNLKSLYLNHNNITEVPRFNLPNLEILALTDNKLTRIPTFDFPNLQYLELFNNPLAEEEKRKLKEKYGKKVKL